jgi:hypothetical protein
VFVRSGRLTAPYVRLICSFCLGLLHVKFKPFWEPSLLILTAAAGHKEGEAELWPLLLDFIQRASEKSESVIKPSNKERRVKVRASVRLRVRKAEEWVVKKSKVLGLVLLDSEHMNIIYL